MFHLNSNDSGVKALSVVVVLLTTILASCTYRFTNCHVVAPGGIRSIAVEAIYDTSKEVLPHELLWESLQKAFARDGHLRVTNRQHADALVIAHITAANVGPTGSVATERRTRDPEVKDPVAVDPRDFRRLPRAGEHTREERLGFQVRIEVVDLRTRRVLLNRNYSGNRRFRSERAGMDIKGFYLVYEEAFENRFREISESIANRVVEDLLIRF